METEAPRRRITASVVFLVIIIVGVSVFGVAALATNHTALTSPIQTATTSSLNSALESQTTTQTTQTTQFTIPGTPAPPLAVGLPPLPTSLLGVPAEVDAYYDNEFFSGEQGSYCWAGNADTVQNDNASTRVCQSVPSPTQMSNIPTIAVYPNATILFEFPKDNYFGVYGGASVNLSGKTFGAQLYESGSMIPVDTALVPTDQGFAAVALGTLPVGNYILRTNTTLQNSYTVDYFGIQEIGSVKFNLGSIKISICTSDCIFKPVSEGPALKAWMLTLSSPAVVRGVNLSAISVISGVWMRFLPSYLPQVGPNGTEAEMLVNGALRPYGNNDISNVTTIIQATGSGGATGEVGLPLEGGGGSVVFHSLASAQQFEIPNGPGEDWSIAQGETTSQGATLIYDPPSPAANQSLPVTVSIAGLYQVNGSITALPSWLQFSVPANSTNLSILPYQPLMFAITSSCAASAPISVYTLVLDVQVGSTSLTLFAPVAVGAPINF